MIDGLKAWWRARTERERALLTGLGVVLGLVMAPLAALQAASVYRAQAALELAAAQRLANDVAGLRAPAGGGDSAGAAAIATHDGTTQGLAFAAAKAQGLSIARVEPLAGDGARIVFEAAPSGQIYRWFDMVVRQGVQIQRSQITRVQPPSTSGSLAVGAPPVATAAPDLVSAEFELTRQ
jgi:type II secretory pathway component PulM